MRDSIESCFAQCDSVPDCGYFAFSENSGTSTNCALYTAAGGCEDDNNFPTYTAYQMNGGDCSSADVPVLLEPIDDLPCYTAVHDGHCATGWLEGSNTMRDSIESCFAQCDSVPDCGYFAFSENSGTSTNCALYTAAGGCEDDNNFPTYTAYQMNGGDCSSPDVPVLLEPKH